MNPKEVKICIIGLGYVGLPLAIEFGKIKKTLGFDINSQRIENLKIGLDKTNEKTSYEIKSSKLLSFSSDTKELSSCNCFIVTVPTPIDKLLNPDLGPLKKATAMIGKILKKGDIVIYESTVFPGCTEDICVPILEKESKLSFNHDFFCGYSPERINPGDKKHKITDIKKITSGSNEAISEFVDELYKLIIPAGTHKTSSIKIAEAAKIIENTQRDLNIALINELSKIFNKMELDTEAILKAAETKWNFNSFRPGLVGGHCISVDPYYLTYKAKQIGMNPEIILAGRKTNDQMPIYVSKNLISHMQRKGMLIKNSKILIMGFTFKENCSDLRNTQIVDIFNYLNNLSNVEIFDPLVDLSIAKQSISCNLIESPKKNFYDAIIIAVAHDVFKEMGPKTIKDFGKKNVIIYDLKYVLPKEDSDLRL